MGRIPYGNAKPIDGVGYWLSRLDLSPPLSEIFTFERLQLERGKPGYAFDRDWFSPEKAVTRARTDIEHLAELDDHEQAKILWKLEWIKRFHAREANATKGLRSNRIMKALIPQVYAETIALEIAKTTSPNCKNKRRAGTTATLRAAPCEKTWLTWITNYERAGFDVCALREDTRRSGNRDGKLNVKIAVLMLKHAVKYASRNQPKKKHLYTDLCNEIDELPENVTADAGNKPLPYPSTKTFFKVIAKLDKYDVYAGRHGVAAAKLKYAMVHGGLDVTRPGQRVEIDEWLVSLQVLLVDTGLWKYLTPEQQAKVERIRMWLCVAVDCATRCILGMRLARTASSSNVIAVLRMVVSDKTDYAASVGAITPWDMHVSPETVASDSGASLIANDTQSVVIDMTSSPQIPPVGLPYFRARIERIFGTVHTALLSRFHGRTFANTVELGDYNPAAMANLTVEELAWVLVRFVVDAYHNMPHEGLGGETPRNAWIRLTKLFHVNERPDRNKLRAIFGLKLTYKLRKGGIHILGLSYNSEELETYRRRVGDGVDVQVRLDAEDIGAISVRIGKDWLTVDCVHNGFDRVTIRAWTATLEDLRRRFAAEAEVVESVVRSTLSAIQQVAANAVARAGISALIDTPEDVARAERDLAISFSWNKPNPEVSSTGDGLFAAAFPAGRDATTPTEPIHESPPADDKGEPTRIYRMED
jgi:putative transposase